MQIAVTGGTGFLGRYIVRRLIEQGHTLRCWHRSTSDRTGIDSANITWVEGDLTNTDSITPLIDGVDAVVHSALQWPKQRGFRNAAQDDVIEFLEANFMGSVRLFQAAKIRNVGRFVFIATCAVHEVILDDRPLDETHPLWPTRHYGAHKAALEKFVHSYGLGDGWPICSLRPTGIYGVTHPPERSKWYDLVGQVMRGERIDSAHGGKEVHAADVAKAVDVLLRADEKQIAGQAFNCYDRYIADQHVAEIAKELTDSSSEIADVNRGPKHQIETDKLRKLGMEFGGTELLRQTVAELIAAHRSRN